MKYTILFKTSLLFFCLAFPVNVCSSEEYYILGNADVLRKQNSAPSASSHTFYILSPKGDIIKYGGKLPDGYSWLPENRLQLPNGVVLEKNGFLTLPNNEYPEQYDIKSDGSIIAPNGVVLKPKSEEKKQPSTAENKDKPIVKAKKAKEEEKELSIEEILDFDRIFAEEKAAEEAKRKGKKTTPEAKNDKKPVPVAEKEKDKPVPQSKKKGDKFEIPEKAYEDKNLAFLEGCWKSENYKTGMCGAGITGRIAYSRFCFDKSGRGQHTLYEKRGEFKGPATAYIKDNKLHISSGKLYGSGQPTHYVPSTFDCNGSGSKTFCLELDFCPGEKPRQSSIYLKRD